MLQASVNRSRPGISHSSSRPRLVVFGAVAKGFGTQKPLSATQTCPCGSKLVYKECCEPFHAGRTTPSTPEATLRSRFSAYSKGKVDYLLSTDGRAGNDPAQLKRDITAACKSTSFSGLKILEAAEVDVAASTQVIKFQYNSKGAAKQSKIPLRMGRMIGQEAEQSERNLDGSLKVLKTVETSKFEKGADGVWKLAESEILEDNVPTAAPVTPTADPVTPTVA